MSRNKTNSDNNLIYELNLNGGDLGAVSLHLFVEKLNDEMLNKLPSINVKALYSTKGKREPLVKLQFFSSHSMPAYQINNLQEKIYFMAITLRDELTDRIEAAQRSVA